VGIQFELPVPSSIQITIEIHLLYGCVLSYVLLFSTESDFEQYEFEVEDGIGTVVRCIGYGQLERVIQCELDEASVWKDLKEKTRLLALIMPCKTLPEGKDATQCLVQYKFYSAPIVTDLRSVMCVVGRVPRGKTWAIVDRSNDQARTEFTSRLGRTLGGTPGMEELEKLEDDDYDYVY